MLLLSQTTSDSEMVWSCDLAIMGAYRNLMAKGSKVIKGASSGLKAKNREKYSKIHCLY